MAVNPLCQHNWQMVSVYGTVFVYIFMWERVKKRVSGRTPNRIDKDRVASACIVIACWHKSTFRTQRRDVLLFGKLSQQKIVCFSLLRWKSTNWKLIMKTTHARIPLNPKAFYFESQMYSSEVRNNIETFSLTRQTLRLTGAVIWIPMQCEWIVSVRESKRLWNARKT